VRISFTAIPTPKVDAKEAPAPLYDPLSSGFPLALDEEFNGPSLDTALWNTGRYDTRDNQPGDDPPFSRPYNGAEGAAYGPDNVSVSDGSANLTILDSPAPGAPADLPRSTGMINSMNKFSFKYGYVETRAMVPDCGGCWPAFWMVPDDNSWPPEIDIIEYMHFPNYHPGYPHTVFHYAVDGDEGDDQGFEHQISTPPGKPNEWQEWMVTRPAGWTANFLGEWHTYGLLWTPNYASVYIDGHLGATVTGASKIPQKAMYLIYQMAICRTDGASSDGSNCTPELSTPAAGNAMKIDYLRVYTNGA
jgi:beta-glucanase (GH16 family)